MSAALFDIINNMSFAGWGVAIVSFLAVVLSSVVFWQGTDRRSNKFFLFLCLLVGLWGMTYAFFEGAIGTSSVYVAVVMLYLVAAAIPPVTFLFVYVFLNEKSTLSFWKLVVVAILYLMIGGTLSISDFIVGYQGALNGAPGKLIFGQGYPLYLLYVLGFMVAGVVALFRKYKDSTGIFKIAVRNLLIAMLVAYTVTFFITLVAPLIGGGYSLFWIGNVSLVAYCVAVSYILSEYDFWSLKVISTEFFISVITIVLVAELFLATSFLDLFIKLGITMLIIFSSSFLVGSVKRETQSKDRITRLVYDLEIMSKQLKVLDKKKSDFLAIASHHLRDPLTAIKGYASMLTEGSFGQLSPQVSEAVDKIFESSKRLIVMISDFLDISRIESGDMNYKFTDVDMKKIVLDLEYEMKLNADKAHITLSVTVDDKSSRDGSFITVGDSGKLRQVVSNLIYNSIKYTPRGEVSVLLSKSSDGKKIIFSVSDTGIGMSPSTLDKIFKKFSRADGVNKVYTEGTGLGLYVAMEIVKKHEGKIWAESKGEGLGSSFFVELEGKG